MSTLITFLSLRAIRTSCFGAMSAVLNVCSFIPAFAITKPVLAALMPASTFFLSSIFSLAMSRNCLISSSRLSLRSLWPLDAVTSFFLSLVSSILVGLTTTLAICLLLSSKYILKLLDMYYKDNVYMAILNFVHLIVSPLWHILPTVGRFRLFRSAAVLRCRLKRHLRTGDLKLPPIGNICHNGDEHNLRLSKLPTHYFP